jgi:putative membrane protein
MMYWGGGMGPWGYVFMSVSMVLFWALVIGGIVVLVRWVSADRRGQRPPTESVDPRQVLAERYARGEIDETDYRQRLHVLSGQ